jgi:adenylate cyclase
LLAAAVERKSAAPIQELRRAPLGRRLRWGVVIGLVAAIAAFGLSLLLGDLELRTHDWRHRLLAAPGPGSDQVAIVLIDDDSVAHFLGEDYGISFPWPRDFYVPIIEFLVEAGAKAVVFDMIFADPWRTTLRGTDEPDQQFAEAARKAGIVWFATKLDQGSAGLDSQAAVVEKARCDIEGWTFPARAGFRSLIEPLPELVEAARGLGFVNVVHDADNTLRRADLVLEHEGVQVGALGFVAALAALGDRAGDAPRLAGRTVRYAGRSIPVGPDGRLLVRFYGGNGAIATFSAASVIESRTAMEEDLPLSVEPEHFRDKVIVIGIDTAGQEDVVTSPVSSKFRGVEFQATVCANILGGHHLSEPSSMARLGVLLGLGLLAGVLNLAVWRPLPAGLVAASLLVLYCGAALVLFRRGLVIDLFFPALLLGLVYSAGNVAGYLTEWRQKRQVSQAFSRYMSADVIGELMRNPESLRLGGETRHITIFFSDLAGFSTFSEQMSAEEQVAFLNVYLTAMTDIILERRGVLDKYIGDAIVAFWGAPLAIENPSRQACLAALEMRAALATLNERFRAEGRPLLQVRAGLHFGPALVGNIGSSRQFNYTAMGDAVNLASRLEGANKFFGTSVMISESVRNGAGDAIVARRLGRIRVVGKSVPAAVYELAGKDGEVPPAELSRLERYHRAFALLEQGAAGEAEPLFEALLAEAPDPVVELCARKCRELAAEGKSWDGIWVLSSKG